MGEGRGGREREARAGGAVGPGSGPCHRLGPRGRGEPSPLALACVSVPHSLTLKLKLTLTLTLTLSHTRARLLTHAHNTSRTAAHTHTHAATCAYTHARRQREAGDGEDAAWGANGVARERKVTFRMPHQRACACVCVCAHASTHTMRRNAKLMVLQVQQVPMAFPFHTM